jgi:hypothetical protein
MNDSHKYDDMLHLSRPPSQRAKMSMTDRGAQFSPFAALVGYEDAIRETGRITGSRIELTEGAQLQLNEKIRALLDNPGSPARITYFAEDLRKEGGEYVTEICRIKKTDPYGRGLILVDGRLIRFEDVILVEDA